MLNWFKLSKKNFSGFNIQELEIHEKLKTSLIQNNITQLTQFQKNIIDNMNSTGNSMIISDSGTGKSVVSSIFVLNKLLSICDKQNAPVKLKDGDLYVNTTKFYDEYKQNIIRNREKRNYIPKGVLYISPKFEFLTEFYKKLRKFDPNNYFNIIRLGSSLQFITPFVEMDSNENQKSVNTKKLNLLNLTNNTSWSNVDILMTTPMMFDYVTKFKDTFDPFDINPDIVIIDDIDLIISNKQHTDILVSALRKFFSKKSEFFFNKNYNTPRKLIILASSTTNSKNEAVIDQVKTWFPDINIFNDINTKYKKLINNVSIKLFNFLSSSNDEHFSQLIKLIMSNLNQMIVVACKENHIPSLKEYLEEKGENLNFVTIEKQTELNVRLCKLSDFNSRRANILICNIDFIVGMDFKYLDHIILFDEPDHKDFIRLYGRFNQNENERKNDNLSSEKQSFSIFYKSNAYIESLKNEFPFLFTDKINKV